MDARQSQQRDIGGQRHHPGQVERDTAHGLTPVSLLRDLLRLRVGQLQEIRAASAVNVPATSRVNRGANTSPATNAVTAHMSRQNGQVNNSPRLWRS